ncbi:MAG: hypothetical protein ACXVQU_09725, partial [Actinomycetota bacterium]
GSSVSGRARRGQHSLPGSSGGSALVPCCFSSIVERTSYGEGTASEVTLWKLADAGHTWPGHPGGPVLRLLVGRTSSEVDATSEMWRFFQRHI